MDFQVGNDAAVVIGGAKGIGRAIGEAFASEGAAVALVDVDPRVAAAADELATTFSVSAIGLIADAADYAAMQRIREETLARLGHCDHVSTRRGSGRASTAFRSGIWRHPIGSAWCASICWVA